MSEGVREVRQRVICAAACWECHGHVERGWERGSIRGCVVRRCQRVH